MAATARPSSPWTRIPPRRPTTFGAARDHLVFVPFSDRVSPQSQPTPRVPPPSRRVVCCKSHWKRLWSSHRPHLDIPDLLPPDCTRRRCLDPVRHRASPRAFHGRETQREPDRRGTEKRGTKRRLEMRTETARSLRDEAQDQPEPLREHDQFGRLRSRRHSLATATTRECSPTNGWEIVLDKVSQLYQDSDSTGAPKGETGIHGLLGHSRASPASQPLDLSCKKCRKSTNKSETSTSPTAPLTAPFACWTTQQWVELAIHKARILRQASLGLENKQQCTESSDWPPKAPSNMVSR